MQKLKADDFPKSIQRSNIQTYDQDDWAGVGYRPNPNCPICKGSGFVHPVDGDRIIYWRAIPCTERGCLSDSIRGIQPAPQTFDNFIQVPGTEKALKAARSLAFRESKFVWLLMYGPPGNGKTHLCRAIVHELRAQREDVKMVLAADLFSMLREDIKQSDAMLRRFKDIFFLAIDDYGVEYGSEWEMSKFDELMTSRYANARPTVLVTNKELTELPERIQSRFRDTVMARAVHNSAPDFRQRRRD